MAMPALNAALLSRAKGRRVAQRRKDRFDVRLSAISVRGGFVVSGSWPDGANWSAPPSYATGLVETTRTGGPTSDATGRSNTSSAGSRVATLSGTIVATQSGLPVPGADITIPEAGRSTRSYADGRFEIAGLPSGRYSIRIRRLGYGTFVDTVTVGPERHHTFSLKSIQFIDTTRVTASRGADRLDQFEEHHRLKLGDYILPRDLESRQDESLEALLRAFFPAVRMVQIGGRARLAIEMGSVSREKGYCFPTIFVDGRMVSDHRVFGVDEAGFEIDTYSAKDVVGVEYYASRTALPKEYSKASRACAILGLWLRQ